MIRINRLIKKSVICEVLHLPNVAKIELIRGKCNQKDPTVVRVCIYLTRSQKADERAEFRGIMSAILNTPDIPNNIYSTIKTAILDGFIKESTYNKLGIPMDSKYKELCRRYSQSFFDKFFNNK